MTAAGSLLSLLLPLALGIMTTTWAGALLATAIARTAADGASGPPLIILLLWWLGGWVTTRWSLRQPWAERRGGQVVAITGLVAVLVGLWAVYLRPTYNLWDLGWLGALWEIGAAKLGQTLTAPLLAGVAGVLLWWRGVLAGREPYTGYDLVYRAFGLGVVVWVVVLVLAGTGSLLAGLGSQLLLFFMASLSGLALASLESVRRAAREQASTQLALNRFWLAAVGSVILTILALGLLLSSLLAPEVIAGLMGVFGPVINGLSWVLYLVITALAYVIFFFLNPLIEFLRPRSQNTPLPTPPSAPLEDLRRELEKAAQNQTGPPAWVVTLVQILVLAAILIAVLLLLSRAFRRLRALDAEGVEENREYIGSWQLLWAQLAELARRLRRRLRRQRLRSGAANPFVPLEGSPADTGRLSVREAYQRLLALARERGYPRVRSQTPYEYRPTLDQAFPDAGDELEVMTEAYVAARYGPTPPPETIVTRVNRVWQALWGRIKDNSSST